MSAPGFVTLSANHSPVDHHLWSTPAHVYVVCSIELLLGENCFETKWTCYLGKDSVNSRTGSFISLVHLANSQPSSFSILSYSSSSKLRIFVLVTVVVVFTRKPAITSPSRVRVWRIRQAAMARNQYNTDPRVPRSSMTPSYRLAALFTIVTGQKVYALP